MASALALLALWERHPLKSAEWAAGWSLYTALLKSPYRKSSRLSSRLDCPSGLGMTLTVNAVPSFFFFPFLNFLIEQEQGMTGTARRREPGDSCSDVQNLPAAASLLSPGGNTPEMPSRAGAPFSGIKHYRVGEQVRDHWHGPMRLSS